MAERFYNNCIECRIEFEPKTPFIHWGGYQYHYGCFKALEQRGGVVVERQNKCHHYTPAEDSSKWAFAHRTWGCPDEGAVWPHGYEELAMHD